MELQYQPDLMQYEGIQSEFSEFPVLLLLLSTTGLHDPRQTMKNGVSSFCSRYKTLHRFSAYCSVEVTVSLVPYQQSPLVLLKIRDILQYVYVHKAETQEPDCYVACGAQLYFSAG
jgi:hypothetical protein